MIILLNYWDWFKLCETWTHFFLKFHWNLTLLPSLISQFFLNGFEMRLIPIFIFITSIKWTRLAKISTSVPKRWKSRSCIETCSTSRCDTTKLKDKTKFRAWGIRSMMEDLCTSPDIAFSIHHKKINICHRLHTNNLRSIVGARIEMLMVDRILRKIRLSFISIIVKKSFVIWENWRVKRSSGKIIARSHNTILRNRFREKNISINRYNTTQNPIIFQAQAVPIIKMWQMISRIGNTRRNRIEWILCSSQGRGTKSIQRSKPHRKTWKM